MDLYEAIENRRTIRAFKGEASDEQLKKILLAGTQAPSAVNRQPWEFIVVKDPAIIEQLAEMKYQLSLDYPPRLAEDDPKSVEAHARKQRDQFKNASIVVVCHEEEWERSVWMCIENISLAAVAEGLGSGISLYWDETQHAAGELLKLPPNYTVTAVLKIGIPAEAGFAREQNPYAPRREEFSWLHYDRY